MMRHALALAIVTLTACTGADPEGYFGTTKRHGKDTTTFYVNNGAEPEYLDPGLAADTASSTLLEDLFEGLVVKHPKDLRATQGVATHWDQDDNNTLFRFHLRPDARWSDGKAVVAEDFAYSWRRLLTAKTGARMATMLYVIKNGKLFHQGKLKTLSRDVTLASAPGKADGKPLKAGRALRILDKPKDGWLQVTPHQDLPTFRPATKPDEADSDDETAKDDAPRGWVPADALKLDTSVLGIRTPSERVLEVQLEHATPYFIELCGFTTLYPVRRDLIEHFEKLGRPDLWYRPENIITNGPYTLEDWQFRYQIVFKRNPHHYDHDKLKLHRIVWLEVEDYSATVNLYATGDLDWIGSNLALPPKQIETLQKMKDFSRAPYLSTYWYEFNVDKKPVDDSRVRRALNLAVDKQLLIDKVTRGGQWPATHFVPDFTGSGYAEQARADKEAGVDPFSGKGHDFDGELARKLLAEAGYPVERRGDGWMAKGFPSLEILYNTSTGSRAIAVAIQAMWKSNLGVTAQLRNEEWKVMIKNLRDGHFQVARLGWTGDYNHPHTWADVFLSYSGNNWTHWSNKEYDRQVEAAAAMADPVAGIKAYRRAEALAVAEMPRMPLYFYTKSTMIKPYVKGFWDNASNDHYMRWMWIDPDWRNNTDNAPSYPPRELPKPGRIAAK